MSSEQTQREKFEAYAQGRPWLQLHRDEEGNGYVYVETYEAWLAWQEATAQASNSAVIEAAKNLVKVKGRHHSELAMNKLVEAVKALERMK